MRKVKLSIYCRKNLNNYWTRYYDGKRTFTKGLSLAKKDHRLALLLQSYYYSTKYIELANKFAFITLEEYKTYESFANSNSKYPQQFREIVKQKNEAKEYVKTSIRKIIKKKQISLYKIAKHTRFSKSKLYACFNQNDNTAMSLERLIKLRKYLSLNKNNASI